MIGSLMTFEIKEVAEVTSKEHLYRERNGKLRATVAQINSCY